MKDKYVFDVEDFDLQNPYNIQIGWPSLSRMEDVASPEEIMQFHNFCLRNPASAFNSLINNNNAEKDMVIAVWDKEVEAKTLILYYRTIQDIVAYYGEKILGVIDFDNKELRFDLFKKQDYESR